MEKSKKFRMPAGIRNKLMAAIAMLLVSSIMMVSSTYAWFTLSTAPEVTGITTSVGANGNLEIALLNNTTGANMSAIASGVGDSSAVKDVALANVTWGNLVDLSDASYGLTGIALLPAALNNGSGTVSMTNPLLIAEYGADGRVATTNGQTLTAVADANGAFAVSDTPVYGVRAIGTTSSMSVREIALRNAKSTVSATVNSAKAATKSAINLHMVALIGFATGTVTTFTDDDLNSVRAIANAVAADLATLESGYKNAAIAYAASAATDDTAYATAKAALDALSFSQLAAVAGDYGLNATAMNALISAQTETKAAQTALNSYTTENTADEIKTAVQKLASGVEQAGTTVYIADGAIGELGKQLGTFELASAFNYTVYAGAEDSTTATYVTLADTVAGLNVTGGASTTSNITDTYGYVIDFAFRTNASGSNLMLQTAAANRVYSDATAADLATQGAGSTVTYAFTSGMTADQVNALLGAIRLVFLGADGTVYKTATLTDIVVGDAEATANVKLEGQTGDTAAIVALAQNTATAVSVLVYLDGHSVDNADVPNAASSGMLNLNLQFSSDAELVPMKNTALQTMTAYTVSFNANGGTGIMHDAKAYSATYTLPTTSTFVAPSGKVFDGWSLEANGAKIEGPITLEGATTLYARWADAPAQPETPVTYTVTFNANDEGVTENQTLSISSMDGAPTVQRDGYTFLGWSINEDAEAADESFTLSEGLTLYAVWATA